MKKNIIWILYALIAFFAIQFGKRLYYKPNLESGQDCPAFELVTMTGKNLNLNDFKGSYLLLDFWGSWCGPCRRNNPILRDLIRKYEGVEFKNAKRLDIISVGIESDENKWRKAIEEDRMDWDNQVSSLKRFEDPLAKALDIRSIPSYVLVGPDSKILQFGVGLNDIDYYLLRNKK